jgi:hypothetical protein
LFLAIASSFFTMMRYLVVDAAAQRPARVVPAPAV